VYGYLNKLVSLEETVEQIAAAPNSPIDIFVNLIEAVVKKIEDGKSNPA
jgi:hypothetical protein